MEPNRTIHVKNISVNTYFIKRTEPLRQHRRYVYDSTQIAEQTQRFVENQTQDSNHHRNSNEIQDDELTTDWTPEIPFGNVCKCIL